MARGKGMSDVINPRAVTDLDQAIGERIRDAREEDGLTLQGLAAQVGLSHQQLQKYEVGVNRICASRLYHVALALDRPVMWFYGEENSQPAKLTSSERKAVTNARNALTAVLESGL
jgi:transcriptional regulator with XRE-family HTH domain